MNGELGFVWRKVKRNEPTRGLHLLPIGGRSSHVVGKKKNNVFVSYRGRVTKVAPECLRKASVAE